jgi:hypothetical protein
MEELKESKTHTNGYYLGDLIGTLQYKKDYNTIKNLVLPINPIDNADNWIFESHSLENLNRLTPLTPSGNKNWKIILIIIKYNQTSNCFCMKGALLNKDTNMIALLTSINNKQIIIDHGNRPIKTKDPQWFVGHYRMIAPLFFWRELKNRLNY